MSKNVNVVKKESPSKRKETLFDVVSKLGEKYNIIPQDHRDGDKFKRSISTGIAALDADLNYGKGLPLGIMCEFFGKESGGKSYLAQRICAQAQKKYPELAVVYVDLENSIVQRRIEEIGVDVSPNKYIEVPQIGNAEKTFEYLLELLREFGDKISLIVVDSLKALSMPEWSMDKQKTHLAQFLSKYIPEMHALCTKTQTTTILINQMRVDLSAVMSGFSRGPTYITPGGDTVNYFAHIRLEIKRLNWKEGMIIINNRCVGHKMTIVTKKSKLGIPQQSYSAPLFYVPVALEDRLFLLGRANKYAGENKQIISVRNETYSFKDFKEEGEINFKKGLFNDNLLIDLFDELACVCDVEGLSRLEVEEDYKNGPGKTDLKNTLSPEEAEEKWKQEEERDEMDVNRQLEYASSLTATLKEGDVSLV